MSIEVAAAFLRMVVRNNQLREELAELAGRHGFRFSPDGRSWILRAWAPRTTTKMIVYLTGASGPSRRPRSQSNGGLLPRYPAGAARRPLFGVLLPSAGIRRTLAASQSGRRAHGHSRQWPPVWPLKEKYQ
jgi:hypothetical protein